MDETDDDSRTDASQGNLRNEYLCVPWISRFETSCWSFTRMSVRPRTDVPNGTNVRTYVVRTR